jgi:hypothetical protein
VVDTVAVVTGDTVEVVREMVAVGRDTLAATTATIPAAMEAPAFS